MESYILPGTTKETNKELKKKLPHHYFGWKNLPIRRQAKFQIDSVDIAPMPLSRAINQCHCSKRKMKMRPF